MDKVIQAVTNSSSDKQFISNSDKWVNYPLLPVKNYKIKKYDLICGIMVAGDNHTVYLVNMYNLKTGFLKDILKDVPKNEYANIDELLNAGWEVD